jgi:hypothetical protein
LDHHGAAHPQPAHSTSLRASRALVWFVCLNRNHESMSVFLLQLRNGAQVDPWLLHVTISEEALACRCCRWKRR